MPEPTRLPFTVRQNEPTILEVKTGDGAKYEVTIRVAIFSVTDVHQPMPTDPTLPTLEFQASLVTSTKRIDS